MLRRGPLTPLIYNRRFSSMFRFPPFSVDVRNFVISGIQLDTITSLFTPVYDHSCLFFVLCISLSLFFSCSFVDVFRMFLFSSPSPFVAVFVMQFVDCHLFVKDISFRFWFTRLCSPSFFPASLPLPLCLLVRSLPITLLARGGY